MIIGGVLVVMSFLLIPITYTPLVSNVIQGFSLLFWVGISLIIIGYVRHRKAKGVKNG